MRKATLTLANIERHDNLKLIILPSFFKKALNQFDSRKSSAQTYFLNAQCS